MSFAFKIDKALKANLYKICRLCGIDRDDKYDILDAAADNQEPVDCDGELKLHEKIIQCIGITICKDDRMPQSACGLCVDKINDFYEFREMCYATDVQTRKLLGLKSGTQKKVVDVKPSIYIKEEVGVKRGRKRKSDETISRMASTEIKRETFPIVLANKKQRMNEPPSDSKKKGKFGKIVDKALKPKEEIEEEAMDLEKPSTNSNITKFRQVCNICDQGFISKLKLDQHIAAIHTPNIPRYICSACNETIKKTNDIKSHQLWHKLTKTPYICGHCGQSLISSYAYSRHLRDHTVEIPPNIWVLDRECPQCHQTFLTNFLYNTHLCAVRTKKCAGCNRQLRNEAEYQRHAAHCAKVYLNYSKHIPVAVLAAESTIRIKNENEVEAAAAEDFARNAGISLEMTPIVSLTRISTAEIIAASHGSTSIEYVNDSTGTVMEDAKISEKKGSKKGVSRKDLKRVDNLLKSTLDVLVSIKHEPEVHVEIDSETSVPSEETAKTGMGSLMMNEDGCHNDDDFHQSDDNDDDNDGDNLIDESESGSGHATDVAIKREPNKDCVQIKQKLIDVNNENSASTTKMPVLKLKIKKEHGTLNSSIVEEQIVRSEKKKKKKKRRDVMRIRDKSLDESELTTMFLHEKSEVAGDTLPSQRFLRPIKQEQLGETDHYDTNKVENTEAAHPEPTVMTTIPIPQFKISAVTSGVEFASSTEGEGYSSDAATTAHNVGVQGEIEDIKPNKAELDLLFKITSVSSGVHMEHEQEREIEKEADCSTANANCNAPVTSMAQRSPSKIVHKVVKHKGAEQKLVTHTRSAKAFKSTSGVSKIKVDTNSENVEANMENFPQIQIKPEPVDRGYEDIFNAFESATNSAAIETLQISMREMAETDYINSIDFGNVQIKQEKELDVSDVGMTNTHIVANTRLNGNRSNCEESQYSENDEDSDSTDNEESDGGDDNNDNDNDWVGVMKVAEEKREYRELEMPPLLSTEIQESKENVDASEIFKFTCTPRNDIIGDLHSVGQTSESENVEAKPLERILNKTASVNQPGITSVLIMNTNISKSNNEDLLVSPLMITGIYSQTDGGISNKSPQTNTIVRAQDEVRYADDVNDPLDEMPPLKLTSVVAGCSTNFDYLPKDYNPPPFTEQRTLVGDGSKSSNITNNGHSDLKNEISEDPYAEARTMSFEINQNKDTLLTAQPFSDDRTAIASAIGSSHTVLNTNTLSDAAQNIPAELVGEHLVEEEQNALNQVVAEAQTIQRVINTRHYVEESENLMNETIAEAQLQQRQRQEPQAEVQTRNNMHLPQSDLECCESASGSVEGSCQSRMMSHAFLLDEDNINEIAENNNNANIERELQDDAASTVNVYSNAANSVVNDIDSRSNIDMQTKNVT